MAIEVEVRSFISEDKYNELLEFFAKEGKLIKEDDQDTYYFDCDEDLRIQKNKFFSKIWMKKGKIHDEQREEIEIKFDKDKFDELEKLFIGLGMGVEIKWFRKRHVFEWGGVEVCVDYTRGYGYIVEFEKMADEENKDSVLAELKQKFESLGISLTPKEDFNKKYDHYKENWKDLVGEK